MADETFNNLCNFCQIGSIRVLRVTDLKYDAKNDKLKMAYLKWQEKNKIAWNF